MPVPTNHPDHADSAFRLTVPAYLIPTADGDHLYLDAPMNWPSYQRLLRALAKAKVIDAAWTRAAIRSQQTHLPAPWRVATDRPADARTDLPVTDAEREALRHRFMLLKDPRPTTAHTHRPIVDTTLRYTRLPAKATHLSSRLTGNHPKPLHSPTLALTVPATLTTEQDGTDGLLSLAGLTPGQHKRATAAFADAGLTD
jgi:hypothetical protein